MTGENFVRLRGFLSRPKLDYTRNGYAKFSGSIAVPISYRKDGQEIDTRIFHKISAWNDTAEAMKELVEETAIEIHGHINQRTYNSPCKSCGTPDKKYWTEVQVDHFMIVEEE